MAVSFSGQSLKVLKEALKAKDYKVYENGELNIVGVRQSHEATNRFDDTLIAFVSDGGIAMDCTTDPGTYYLEHPMNDAGCAVLAPGQYLDSFAIGMHKGQYEAIVQVLPVTVYRDRNLDGTLDYTRPESGMFGIHIHRANAAVKSKLVDRWSAGCTVVADPDDFRYLMSMAKRHVRQYGPRFTYTLIEEGDISG